MTFSLFGDKFTRHSGITRLMEDLNDGLRTPGAIMLGGGNPAQIPEMQNYFQSLLADMLENGKATDALCRYDGPQGKTELLSRAGEDCYVRGAGLGYRATKYCTDKWQSERIFLFYSICSPDAAPTEQRKKCCSR